MKREEEDDDNEGGEEWVKLLRANRLGSSETDAAFEALAGVEAARLLKLGEATSPGRWKKMTDPERRGPCPLAGTKEMACGQTRQG